MIINATEKAYNEIQRRILELELPPGTYISRNDIAEQLEISKTPIREALQFLENDGLVKIFPQSRTIVTKINIDEIKKTNFLRVAIESEVIREMMEHTDKESLTLLAKNLEKQEQLVDNVSLLQEFDTLDKEFHDIMFKSVGQEALNGLLRSKMGHKIRASKLGLLEKGKIRKLYEDHKSIYEAIRDKDPKKANEALRTHLSRTISKIEELKKERPYFFD